jgi:hypothetical protein
MFRNFPQAVQSGCKAYRNKPGFLALRRSDEVTKTRVSEEFGKFVKTQAQNKSK